MKFMSFRPARHVGACAGFGLLALAVFSLLSIASAVDYDLPVLDLIPRRDWFDVKINGTARGDGVTDDTDAIQFGLDFITASNSSRPTVLYIPPGNYRITKRLRMVNKNGCQLRGHGAPSRLFWDAPAESTETWMFECDGNTQGTFSGIHFDGSGKIDWGFVQSGRTAYESNIRHEFNIYSGFKEAAFRNGGTGEAYASSEQTMRDCVFFNNPNGCIQVQNPNYYNHQFIGNDFYGCGVGISMVWFAQGSMRRNHFEGSTEADMEGGEPSFTHSIRQSSSVGSRMFFRHGSNSNKYNIQAVTVEGWTNPMGAIISRDRVPRPIVDARFLNPPSNLAPIRFNVYTTWRVDKVVGGIIYNGPAPSPVLNLSPFPYYTINRTPSSAIPPRGDVSWRVSRPNMGSSVIDCVGEYTIPYRARGFRNDTAAVQDCINEAKRRNNNAVAYFRRGVVYVTSPIVIDGGNYIVEGAGYHTLFQWNRACVPGLPTLKVVSPQNITIRNFRFGWAPDSNGNCTELIHTRDPDATGGSYATYDRIWGNPGSWYRNYTGRELAIFDGLSTGDVVHVMQMKHMIRVRNCARATLFFEFLDSTPFIVEGEETVRDGYIGIEYLNGNALQVYGNQEIHIGDYYFEQSADWGNKAGYRPMWFAGAKNVAVPPGRIVIGNAKAMTYDSPGPLSIDDYNGDITWMWATLARQENPAFNQWTIEHNATNSNVRLNLIGIIDDEMPLRVVSQKPSAITELRFPNRTTNTQAAAGYQAMADAAEDMAKLIELAAEFYPIQRYTRTVVSPPTAVPAGGSFAVPINVQLLAPDANQIRYTIDGSDPSGPAALLASPGAMIRIPTSGVLKMLGSHPARQTSQVSSFTYTIQPRTNGVQMIFPPGNETTPTGFRNYTVMTHIGTQFMPTVPGWINRVRMYTTPSEAGLHYVRIWRCYKPNPVWERQFLGSLEIGPLEWQVPNTTGWVYFNIPALRLLAGDAYMVDISSTMAGRASIIDRFPNNRVFFTKGFLMMPRNSNLVNTVPWMSPWASEGTFPHSLRDVEFLPDANALPMQYDDVPPTPDAPQVICNNTNAPILRGVTQAGAIVYAVGSRAGFHQPLTVGQTTAGSDGQYSIFLTSRLPNDTYTLNVIALNNMGLSQVSNSSVVTLNFISNPSCNATVTPGLELNVDGSGQNLGWIAAVVIGFLVIVAVGVALYVRFRLKK